MDGMSKSKQDEDPNDGVTIGKGSNDRPANKMWEESLKEIIPLSFATIALIVSSTVNQSIPRLMGIIMDPTKATNSASCSDSERKYVLQIMLLSTIGGISSFVRTWQINRARDSIAARLRQEVFESLLMRDLEWFQQHRFAGEKIENESSDGNAALANSSKESKTNIKSSISPAAIGFIMKDDVETVAGTLTNTLANLLRSSSSCIFGTYNMLQINSQLVAYSLAVAPLVGSLALITRRHLKKVVAIQQEEAMKSADFVDERLNHIALIKTSNRTKDEINNYHRKQQQAMELGRKSSFISGVSMGTMFFMGSSAFCSVLLVGRRAVKAQKMTSGQLTSFGTYSFMLALGTAGVVKALGEYSKGMLCANRLFSIVHESTNFKLDASLCDGYKKSTENSLNTDVIQKISMANVDFSYPSNPSTLVLRDVCLSLTRGEVVCLVGQNGSGKSTISSLIAKLYLPTNGNIILFGSMPSSLDDANGINREDQNHIVQMVPQIPAFFDTTVLDNIKYARPNASENEVATAMKHANCAFVSTLDGGLKFRVGRNGVRLSGGQRQRIGLARAFLSDPIFLIFDEPTSAMDLEGEMALQDAISTCRSSNRGCLVITHKIKSLEYCDRIVVLKDGSVVQEGSMNDLKKEKKGEFMSLMSNLS